MSKVDQQRAMREARWQNRGVGRSTPALVSPRSVSAVPVARPGGEHSPEDLRPERPAVQPGRAIGAYKQPELVALVEWIMSDGMTRTDSQVLDLVMADLGFARQGRAIRTRVSEAITTVLGTTQAAAS